MINKIRAWESNFSLTKAAFIVGFFALVSRFVGLLRDRLLASRFGAGDTLDSYYAAFRLPDFIFNLLVLGTLSAAFIPIFTEWLHKDKKRADEIANTVLSFSFITMSAICVVLYFNAHWLTKLMVPGFHGEKLSDTISLTKIFLLSPIIFTLSNFFGSMLNAKKRFLVSSFAPILYNGGIVFGIIVLYPKYGLNGLGFGVILGAILHLLAQIIENMATGYKFSLQMNFRDPAVRKIGKLFLPRIFGIDTSQLSLLIASIVGSYLNSGSIAILNLANNLQAVPAGIFGVSTAMASFPSLSESFSKKSHVDFAENFYESLKQILFFVIPISIFILIFRAYIVRLVYGAGNFNWEDTILTFQTLGVFCFGLFSQSILPLLSRAFYARQNTKTPVIVGVGCMALNVFTSWYLAPKFGVIGIALAFVIASILNAAILFVLLRHNLLKEYLKNNSLWTFDNSLSDFLARLLISSVIGGLLGYIFLYVTAPFLNTKTGIGILVQFGVAGLVGLSGFFVSALILKLRNAQKALVFLRKSLGYII